ncbi:SLC13 family permease [Butyrivibrio sp. VCB2001]|uniref:SLC13 family permease n=1 Tax=Butyrivibrio sp. VCB2001 TaxID=1280667 RepID=UPI00041C161D|nr:SLC13 family permease [Butyrivibrio sp. VCB2001]
MGRVFKNIRKIDTVLCIAWILAIISAFFVHPGKEYLGYIDFRSLGILWGLMVIIQGFKENSVFDRIAGFLLSKVTKSWQLAAMLIFMCFFGSMLITNDVALITFVPFALMILHDCEREDMMIPTVVLQTVAANLGSMLTPIGNPQNLYLYGLTGMRLDHFVMIMLPFSLVSAVLLVLGLLIIPGREKSLKKSNNSSITSHFESKRQIIIYAVLFAIALLTVVRILPWYVFAIIVLVIVGGMDYKILFRADYILLLTFIGFFIFTGNMGRIEVISSFLQEVLIGREFGISVALSQIISNVPATLMLSGFTINYKSLLIGVNVGGLGTLIASMASLISYKAYSKEYQEKSGKYLLVFTAVNVVFLIALVLTYVIIRYL